MIENVHSVCINTEPGFDIPDGAVWCVMGYAFGATGIGFSPVGASNIEQDDGKVYTK